MVGATVVAGAAVVATGMACLSSVKALASGAENNVVGTRRGERQDGSPASAGGHRPRAQLAGLTQLEATGGLVGFGAGGLVAFGAGGVVAFGGAAVVSGTGGSVAGGAGTVSGAAAVVGAVTVALTVIAVVAGAAVVATAGAAVVAGAVVVAGAAGATVVAGTEGSLLPHALRPTMEATSKAAPARRSTTVMENPFVITARYGATH